MNPRCPTMPRRTSGGFAWHVLAAIVVVGLLASTGCGRSGPPSYRVSGKLTYQGEPIPAGVVFFDPDVSQGNGGPQGFAPIRDGCFDTAADGKGTVAGPHVVRVFGYDGIAAGEGAELGRPLFPEYTTKRDLPRGRTTLELDVPAEPARP